MLEQDSKVRYFFAAFFSIFGLIGICVIFFLWFGMGNGDGPPLFFKVAGSLVAVAFILFSVGAIRSVLAANKFSFENRAATGGSYTCRSCGAGLGDEIEVSPAGDAKCQYCGNWFNIHGKS